MALFYDQYLRRCPVSLQCHRLRGNRTHKGATGAGAGRTPVRWGLPITHIHERQRKQLLAAAGQDGKSDSKMAGSRLHELRKNRPRSETNPYHSKRGAIAVGRCVPSTTNHAYTAARSPRRRPVLLFWPENELFNGEAAQPRRPEPSIVVLGWERNQEVHSTLRKRFLHRDENRRCTLYQKLYGPSNQLRPSSNPPPSQKLLLQSW